MKRFNPLPRRLLPAAVLLSCAIPGVCLAQAAPVPSAVQGVKVDEKLGAAVPLDLQLTDQDGNKVLFGSYFRPDRPVVLVLGYFRCPMLCPLVLTGIEKTLKSAGWKIGKDFQAVYASIDPRDTPAVAREHRHRLLQSFGIADKVDGETVWPFLTGTGDAVGLLASTVGFHYKYDPSTGQYAHPAVIFILSPDGHVSRYLYGIQFPPRDLRLSLADAAKGKAGPTLDRFLLCCFHYDPATRRYGTFIVLYLRIGGLLIFAALAILLGRHWRRELRARESSEKGGGRT